MTIKILLVDDHKALLSGLKVLLEAVPGFEVLGRANDGRAAVRLAEELEPDVVVMDIGLPDLNGLEATRRIVKAGEGPRVLAFSMYTGTRYVAEMLKAGVSGYLHKSADIDEVIDAIRTVREGRTYLSPEVSERIVEDYVSLKSKDSSSAHVMLSNREREVLQGMAEGRSTKELACALHISTATVETHRRRLMMKLDLHTVAELTKYAIREGLTSLEA
jgi:DNA-binding NarL/FixJ family response regulator